MPGTGAPFYRPETAYPFRHSRVRSAPVELTFPEWRAEHTAHALELLAEATQLLWRADIDRRRGEALVALAQRELQLIDAVPPT